MIAADVGDRAARRLPGQGGPGEHGPRPGGPAAAARSRAAGAGRPHPVALEGAAAARPSGSSSRPTGGSSRTRWSRRPKHGFEIPIDAWLRGPLRDLFESAVLDPRARVGGLVDQAAARRALPRPPRRDRAARRASSGACWSWPAGRSAISAPRARRVTATLDINPLHVTIGARRRSTKHYLPTPDGLVELSLSLRSSLQSIAGRGCCRRCPPE